MVFLPGKFYEQRSLAGYCPLGGKESDKTEWLSLSLTFNLCSQYSSVSQSCPTLCNPVNCSTPGFPVHHQLPDLAHTYVLWVGDAIQLSHLLLSPSPPASHLSQHQSLFQSGGRSIGVSPSASALPMNIQDWFPLGLTGLISLQSNSLSRVFSNTTVQKHQFFSVQLSLWSNSHIHTWILEKSQLWLFGHLSAK